MQDTIDCNKINKIREERMQTQFYTGSATTRAYVQYSSNPLEISTICVKSFTTSEPHRDNPSLVFSNPYNSRDPWSLNKSHWIRRLEEEFSLQEQNFTMKIHGWTLNGFASVCPRVLVRAFDNEILFEFLSFPFERIRHFGPAKLSFKQVLKPIYRPLMAIHKSNEKMWLLAYFLKTLHW